MKNVTWLLQHMFDFTAQLPCDEQGWDDECGSHACNTCMLLFYHLWWLGVTSPYFFSHSLQYCLPHFDHFEAISHKEHWQHTTTATIAGKASKHSWMVRDSFVFCGSCCYRVYLTTNARDWHKMTIFARKTRMSPNATSDCKNLQATQRKEAQIHLL